MTAGRKTDIPIVKDTVLQRNPKQLFSEVDDEIVMLSVENSEYYHLDNTGRDIWNFLSEPHTFGELIDSLVELYDVSAEQCRQDIIPFLKELLEHDIIEANG